MTRNELNATTATVSPGTEASQVEECEALVPRVGFEMSLKNPGNIILKSLKLTPKVKHIQTPIFDACAWGGHSSSTCV